MSATPLGQFHAVRAAAEQMSVIVPARIICQVVGKIVVLLCALRNGGHSPTSKIEIHADFG